MSGYNIGGVFLLDEWREGSRQFLQGTSERELRRYFFRVQDGRSESRRRRKSLAWKAVELIKARHRNGEVLPGETRNLFEARIAEQLCDDGMDPRVAAAEATSVALRHYIPALAGF